MFKSQSYRHRSLNSPGIQTYKDALLHSPPGKTVFIVPCESIGSVRELLKKLNINQEIIPSSLAAYDIGSIKLVSYLSICSVHQRIQLGSLRHFK
jgi:hypothetical protein